MDYIMVDDDLYHVGTAHEFIEAKAALREAGISSAPIYRGDDDGDGFDDIRTDLILFA